MKKLVSFLVAFALSVSLSLSLIQINPTTIINTPPAPSAEINQPSNQANLPDVIVDEH